MKSWYRARRRRLDSIPVRRGRVGFSAEPEQAAADGRERFSSRPGAATAAKGTMPNNEPRKTQALHMKGDAAENGGIPAGRGAHASRTPRTRSESEPTAPAQRTQSASMPTPTHRRPSRHRARQQPIRAAGPFAATDAVQTAPSAGADIWFRSPSQKNEADGEGLLHAGCKTSFRPRGAPRPAEYQSAPISARQGGLYSHHGRPVRIHRRGRPSSAAI